MGEDVATPETHEMSYGKTEQAVAVVQLAGLGDAQNQAGGGKKGGDQRAQRL